MTNLLKTIPNDFSEDQTGRKQFALNLIDYLDSARHWVDGSFVATLNGSYGSGKTVFLDLLCTELEKVNNPFRDDTEDLTSRIIRVNAWQGDYIGDPVLQLVSEIYNDLFSDDHKEQSKEFKKITSILLKTSGSLLKGYIKEKIGKEATEQIIEASKAYKDTDGDILFDTALKEYNSQKKQITELTTLLSKICDDGNKPILIIVDELDRCKPDYAVHFLETLKHLFDAKGVVFLLATDLGSLESTVKCMFGEGIKFKEYYRKFSHNTINLPNPNPRTDGYFFKQQLHVYLSPYFSQHNQRDYHDQFHELTDLVTKFVGVEKYTLRQLQHFFRVFALAINSRNNRNFDILNSSHVLLVGLLSLLYVIDESLYKHFTKKPFNIAHICDGIKNSKYAPFSRIEWEAYAHLIGAIHSVDKTPPLNFVQLFPSAPQKKYEKMIAESKIYNGVFEEVTTAIDFHSNTTH